ncbi:hypothetical protein D3C76_1360880 [compost metagenome]
MVDCTGFSKYFDSSYRINPLPPQMAWVQVAAYRFAGRFPELQHGIRGMGQEAAVQFNADLHTGRFRFLVNAFPVRDQFMFPLIGIAIIVFGWPRQYRPVHMGIGGIPAGHPGETIHNRNVHQAGQFDRLAQ